MRPTEVGEMNVGMGGMLGDSEGVSFESSEVSMRFGFLGKTEERDRS